MTRQQKRIIARMKNPPTNGRLIGRWFQTNFGRRVCYCPIGWMAHVAGVEKKRLLYHGEIDYVISSDIARAMGIDVYAIADGGKGKGMRIDRFFFRLKNFASKIDRAEVSNNGRREMLDKFVDSLVEEAQTGVEA